MCAVYIAYKRVTDRPVEANSRALFFVFEVYLLNAYAKMRQEKNNRISKHKITTYESRSCVNSTPERSRCREMHFGSFVLSVDSIARILVFCIMNTQDLRNHHSIAENTFETSPFSSRLVCTFGFGRR